MQDVEGCSWLYSGKERQDLTVARCCYRGLQRMCGFLAHSRSFRQGSTKRSIQESLQPNRSKPSKQRYFSSQWPKHAKANSVLYYDRAS